MNPGIDKQHQFGVGRLTELILVKMPDSYKPELGGLRRTPLLVLLLVRVIPCLG